MHALVCKKPRLLLSRTKQSLLFCLLPDMFVLQEHNLSKELNPRQMSRVKESLLIERHQ